MYWRSTLNVKMCRHRIRKKKKRKKHCERQNALKKIKETHAEIKLRWRKLKERKETKETVTEDVKACRGESKE